MKIKILAILIILLTLSQHSISQDTTCLEIRKDWHQIYSLGRFNKLNMVKTDNDEFYVAYYSNHRNRRYAILMKLNSKGELLWENQVNGMQIKRNAGKDSEIGAICLDNSGSVIIMGSIYNSSVLASQDNTSQDTILINDQFLYFVAKYDSNGVLIWNKTYGHIDGILTISSLLVNEQNEIYYCGSKNIPIWDKERRSQTSDPSICFGKFNQEGEKLWDKTYNSSGSDGATDLVIDRKGNVYMAGSFTESIRIEKDSIIKTEPGQSIFIAKYNDKGKHQWTFSSLKGRSSIKAICIDDKDNLYFSGIFWSLLDLGGSKNTIKSERKPNMYLASISRKGKVRWLKKITQNESSHGSAGITSMQYRTDDGLYISGVATEVMLLLNDFSVQGFEMKYGKESQHKEGYFIYCDVDGNPQYIRTVTGKTSQTIDDFFFRDDGDIVVGGQFIEELNFKNDEIRAKGNVFFAGIPFNSLQNSDPDSAMVAKQKEDIRRKSINQDDCSCELYQEPLKGRHNLYKISYIISKNAKKNIPKYLYKVDLDSLPIFIYNLQTDFSSYSSDYWASFSIKLFDELKYQPGENSVIIDFTPCELKDAQYIITKGSIFHNHVIKEYFNGFNVEEFKETAKEYFDISVNINHLSINTLIESVIYNYDFDDGVQITHPFIKHLNNKYKISIDVDNYELSIEDQIENTGKSIPMYSEIYQYFYEPLVDSNGKLTNEFKSFHDNIIYRSDASYEIENIQNILYPKYSASAEFKRIKIDFNQELINSTTPYAMFRVDKVDWSSDKGFEIDYKEMDQFCMKEFSIANTGLKVKIDKGFPDLSIQMNDFESRDHFSLNSWQSINIPKEFTGLYVSDCKISIPLNNNIIQIDGKDWYIASNYIMGLLEIDSNPQLSNNEQLQEKLELFLSQKGFKDVKTFTKKDKNFISLSYKIDRSE